MKFARLAPILFTAIQTAAQTQSAPAFEVASVKVSPPRTGPAAYTALDSDPSMVRYSNITLRILIAMAYRIDSRLVTGGPGWVDSDPFDVAAKLPPDTPKDQVPAMMQTLLAERFKLAVHRETKEQRAYFLVVGKNGAKLKEGKEASQNQIIPGGIMGHSMDLRTLAGSLARVTGYQVVDKTGIAGSFDINLRYARENTKDTGPDMFAALQEQLGLKLEPGRAPVETLVIDHADRIPVEN